MAARLRAILSQSQRNAARIDEKNLSNPWQANHPESIPALKEAMEQATDLGGHMKYGFLPGPGADLVREERGGHHHAECSRAASS
jgi:hypothetical protein